MKKLLTSALAALGMASSSQAAPVETVDAKAIRFTMPTVAADQIEFVMPTKESFDRAPQFHEDEWRQLEFFPVARLAEIKQKLSEYKVFEQTHRTSHGWTEIYARRLGSSDVLLGKGAVAQIAQALSAKQINAPILTTTSRPLGQVKGGFTVSLKGGVFLYGLTSESGVGALAAMVERGGDDTQLTRAFSVLSKAHKLILVDWRAQMLLVSVAPSGELNVWRP